MVEFNDAPIAGAGIGMIYPPPEVRNIIDKTAGFVARNGSEFEKTIREREANNPKFNFLRDIDPYHAYYRMKVREGDNPTPVVSEAAAAKAEKDMKEAKQLSAKQQQLVRDREELVQPPEFEFSTDPPSLNALDMDVVKLTAQFVARSGRAFLTDLMSREARNFQFDFLRPQHSYFNYFTKLVEQYSKVYLPTQKTKDTLKQDAESFENVMKRVQTRVKWTQFKETEKKELDEREAAEKTLFQKINWNDFVIVETVDFPIEDNSTEYPPPIRKEEIGSRLVYWERLQQQEREALAVTQNEQEQAMDLDVDMEESDDESAAPAPKPVASRPSVPLPVLAPATTSAPVKIVSNYDPKKAAQQEPVIGKQKLINQQNCPRCGLSVDSADIGEHLRICLLDPKWKENKDKAEREKREVEKVLAQGANISNTLKHLAERRSDIFGNDDVPETSGSASGNTSDWASLTRAMATESQSHRKKEEDVAGRFSAAAVAEAAAAAAQASKPAPLLQPPAAVARFPAPAAPVPQVYVPSTVPGVPGSYAAPPGFGLAPPGVPIVPVPGAPGIAPKRAAEESEAEDVILKRPRTAAEVEAAKLSSEADWIQNHPGPVTFTVEMPQVPERPEWKCNGQRELYTLDIKSTIADLKAAIQERTGMPASKQKPALGALFLKDAHTLGFYNASRTTLFQIQTKDRGKKKD